MQVRVEEWNNHCYQGRFVRKALLPAEFQDRYLYSDQTDLEAKLEALLAGYPDFQDDRQPLSAAMEKYAWELMAPRYDRELERLVSAEQSY